MAIRGGSLPRATKPRSTPDRATDSHDHLEVVAALKWRIEQRHAARGAYSVCIGPTGASNLCNHGPVADRTPIEYSLKLMIDGTPSAPFSAATLAPGARKRASAGPGGGGISAHSGQSLDRRVCDIARASRCWQSSLWIFARPLSQALPPWRSMNFAKASNCCLMKLRVVSSVSSPVLSSNLDAQLPMKISGWFRVKASRNNIMRRKSY